MCFIHICWKLLSFPLISLFPKAWANWLNWKQTKLLFVSGNWKCLGCFSHLCTLPTLHPLMFITPPQCGIFSSSEACPVNYGKRRHWSAARVSSQEQNLQKYCKENVSLTFSRRLFLKCLHSKVWILILSKSNDTEPYILNNNCYANAIDSCFL